MAISLAKGGNVSLSKQAPGLAKILVGLGWDARVTDGKAFDLDASAFLVREDGKVRSNSDFIFYNQSETPDRSVVHTGDNLDGGGEGDDESIKINLAALPNEIQKVVFAVTIHEADTRGQNFGMVSNAFIRVVNDGDGAEIARYDLSEDASTETSMLFGEIYRNGAEWKFRAIGQGFAGGLGAMAQSFGVQL